MALASSIVAFALMGALLYVVPALWQARKRRVRMERLQRARADIARVHDSVQSTVCRAGIVDSRAQAATQRHQAGDAKGALDVLTSEGGADAALRRYALRFDAAQGGADHGAMRDIMLACYVDPVVPVERRMAMFGIMRARATYTQAARPYSAPLYIEAAALAEAEAACAPTPASRANGWRWAALSHLELGSTGDVVRCCEAAKAVPGLESDHPLRTWVDSTARSALYRDKRQLAVEPVDLPSDTLPAVHVYCHVTEAAIAYRCGDFDATERHAEAADLRSRQVTSGDATVYWFGKLAAALLYEVTGATRHRARALVDVNLCPLPGVGLQILALTGAQRPIADAWLVDLQTAPREVRREILSITECQARLAGMHSPTHEALHA